MSFQDAYERILQSTGLRTQTDVAAMLGVKQSNRGGDQFGRGEELGTGT